ncbi:MAG: GGDEF domain-containing phosphodiesterase [Eubacterium sp.]|nr:GGDEF domain-containing phosphodiesterase [Eubacterium sp.]
MGDRKEKYLTFVEKLVNLTHSEPFDKESYVRLISDICLEYRIAKGDTEFYATLLMEKRGVGEAFCDYDNGKAAKVLAKVRIVSDTKAVVIGTLYCEDGDEERSPEEMDEIYTMLKIIIGFVSRKRLLRILESFGFMDSEGYRNLRALNRYLDVENTENGLGGKVAFHIDLHNFTMVNKDIGRQNGNIVLYRYYSKLQEVIGDTGIIIRLGGDKFVGICDRSVKRAVFDVFSGAVITYDDEKNKRIKVSAAAGVFMIPNPYMYNDPGDIMDKIMIASNIAKNNSGDSIVVFNEKIKESKNHIKRVQLDFRNALVEEEYAVYYQPKVDIDTKKVMGAEALCRWIKNNEVIPPISFIPILELNNDICDLDFYMLEHVCMHLRRWIDEGREVVRVSVNFSRKHLADIDFLPHIVSIVDKYNIPHEYIEVELTETTTDVLFSDLRRVVCGLQEIGIWTAVDDFGVGYSSLNLIKDIPWNVLKIDKSFVPKDTESEDSISNKMFKHVVALAKDIGINCVVEGVETVSQLDVLRRNGCNIAQGYFFDRPLPVEEFENRLDMKVYQ